MVRKTAVTEAEEGSLLIQKTMLVQTAALLYKIMHSDITNVSVMTVEFILFHSSEKWPSHLQKNFWEAAAMYTKTRAHTEQSRTGKYFIAYAHTQKCTVLV